MLVYIDNLETTADTQVTRLEWTDTKLSYLLYLGSNFGIAHSWFLFAHWVFNKFSILSWTTGQPLKC